MKIRQRVLAGLFAGLLLGSCVMSGCAGSSGVQVVPEEQDTQTTSVSTAGIGRSDDPDEEGAGSGFGADAELNVAGSSVVFGSSAAEGEDSGVVTLAQRRIVGSYHTAASIDEIREAIQKAQEWYWIEEVAEESAGTAADGVFSIAATAEDATMSSAPASQNVAGVEHSTTNVQTEGVDEADIAKTDGRYLYTLENLSSGQCIAITAIRDGEMEKAALLQIPAQGDDDRIREFYVDGDRLQVIVESNSLHLVEGDGPIRTESERRTLALTYDIADRKSPKLLGTFSLTGSYRTSRKIGENLYLFADIVLEKPSDDAKPEDWLPDINGDAIAVEDCYLPEEGSASALLIASVHSDAPEQTVDSKMIFFAGGEPYISQSSIVLRKSSYASGTSGTELVRFAFADGKIEAVAAATVRGEIRDTFAIHEQAGILRVLTTSWEDGNINQLFLLDEHLRRVGSIENIAPGEMIYSARFLGDMAYFVTYRNTDPLFAADLSDPRNPRIVGELKVTGFSEYLHFWGEGLLLGIGYETDPDTGWTEGVKLSMFDIHDPAAMEEENKIVMRNADESPAMDQYKTVTIDAEKNLIGFAIRSYEKDAARYVLYRYSEKSGFDRVLDENLGAAWDGSAERARGLYVGDYFYLSTDGMIRSYRLSDLQMVAELAM